MIAKRGFVLLFAIVALTVESNPPERRMILLGFMAPMYEPYGNHANHVSSLRLKQIPDYSVSCDVFVKYVTDVVGPSHMVTEATDFIFPLISLYI